jgi:hypothetical protein
MSTKKAAFELFSPPNSLDARTCEDFPALKFQQAIAASSASD